MVATVVCMFLCAGALAALAERHGDRTLYDVLAALFLMGALSLLGIAIGLKAPL